MSSIQESIESEKPVIAAANVNKSFGSVKALDNFHFEAGRAKCISFLGPNGAGKTTMMKILYGKARPDHNPETRIEVFGFDPRKDELSIKQLSGVVTQEDSLDEELNVLQNLRIYSNFYRMPRQRAFARIEELLQFMELGEKKKAKIKELSGGMKRRLVIARALIHSPPLLILDEPTTGLDPQVRHLIWDKLHNLKKTGVTILLTTHYMYEAQQLADTVIIMDKGKALLRGTVDRLLKDEIEAYVFELKNQQKTALLETLGNNGKYRFIDDRVVSKEIAGSHTTTEADCYGRSVDNIDRDSFDRDRACNSIDSFGRDRACICSDNSTGKEGVYEVVRKEEYAERTLYYTNNQGFIEEASALLSPGEYQVRTPDLEDLFLKATGRHLNELQ